MASLGSSIRSAARATSSAYKRLPIRWRLAGGSAALTLVILCGFAAIVGVLTTRRIQSDFSRQVADAADELSREVKLRYGQRDDGTTYLRKIRGPNLDDYASGQNAAVRIITPGGDYVTGIAGRPSFGPYITSSVNVDGWRVESRARRGRQLRRPGRHPVRAAAVGGPGDRQPREGVPGLRRARRRPARAARRPGHRAAGDGADHRADRSRARGRALARPGGDDPALGRRGRGRRAGAHAGVDARGAQRRPHRDRGRWCASASSSPTPRTSCARR